MRRIIFVIFLIFCGICDGISNDFGARFLGARYSSNPLGENALPDPDPLIRFDAFDCTTFVETVLADGNIKKLNQIRYTNGIPDFINRNHFIETDWIKNNSGLVRDATEQYGKTKQRTVVIDKQNWMKKNHNININTQPQTVKLKYYTFYRRHRKNP